MNRIDLREVKKGFRVQLRNGEEKVIHSIKSFLGGQLIHFKKTEHLSGNSYFNDGTMWMFRPSDIDIVKIDPK